MAAATPEQPPVLVTRATCEYADQPIGIQTPAPAFAWRIDAARRGVLQSEFQVLVARDPDLLKPGVADLWDSGRVSTSRQSAVYAGQVLSSRQRCCWSVGVWTSNGSSAVWSEPQWFELGLLEPSDWDAEWLGHPAGWSGMPICFRSPLKAASQISSARAYVAGLGCHEFRVNGQKIGQSVLDPATSVYARRVLYVTYDITEHLVTGDNMIGVIVGNGWYGMPRLMVQIHIDYADGSSSVLSTQRADGPQWQIATGPILHHSLFDGETYDARRLDEGWDTVGYDPTAAGAVMRWNMASAVDAPGGRLENQSHEPMQVVRTIPLQSVSEPRPGTYVVDFGTILAGWVKLRARGPAGTTITLRFARGRRVAQSAQSAYGRSLRSIHVQGVIRSGAVRAALHLSRVPLRADRRLGRATDLSDAGGAHGALGGGSTRAV